MVIVFTSFKHPKLPISIKIHVTLLQIVYICMTAISLYNLCWNNFFESGRFTQVLLYLAMHNVQVQWKK